MRYAIVPFICLCLSGFVFGQELQSIHVEQMEIPIDSRFGEAVALFEREAAIAAPGENITGRFQGAVYLFNYDGTSWSQTQRITASDASIFDFFGTSVDLAFDVLAVGVPHRTYFGSAYIFEKVDGEYVETTILDPEFPDENYHSMDFGLSVATNGDFIVVGAPGYQPNDSIESGAVFIYEKIADNWENTQMLAIEQANNFAQFGQSVSIIGDRLIVGAPGMDTDVEASGSAFIYRYDGQSWDLEAELISSKHAPNAFFGSSVGMGIGQAIVGIKVYARDSTGATGGAEIFNNSSGQWESEAILTASDGKNVDYFGHDVKIEQNLVAISAIRADHGDLADAGALYIFAKEGDTWMEKEKFQLTADPQAHTNLGNSIDLNDEHLLVGAHLENNVENDNGNAYVLLLDDLVSIENIDLVHFENIALSPNPFREYTEVSFRMKKSARVRVDVLDIQGRLIEHLFNEQVSQGNSRSITWRPDQPLRTGIYMIRFLVEGRQTVLKSVYLGR